MPLNIAETNRTGDYYANAIGGMGNMIAGYIQQNKEVKKQVNANNAFFQMVMPKDVAAEATKQKPGESLMEFAARQDAIKNATVFKMKQEQADLERQKTMAEIAALNQRAAPKPVPFSAGVSQFALPGNAGNVFFDNATREPISNASIQKPGENGENFKAYSYALEDGTKVIQTSKGAVQVVGKDGEVKRPTAIQQAEYVDALRAKIDAGDEEAKRQLQSYLIANNSAAAGDAAFTLGAPAAPVPAPAPTKSKFKLIK